MSGTSTPDPLADAHQLAADHGLFILQVTDPVYDKALGITRHVPAWVVYRGRKGRHATRLGKSRDPRRVLHLVRTLI